MNRAGSTPFDFALSLGSSKMVELLKQFALHCATVKVKVRQIPKPKPSNPNA